MLRIFEKVQPRLVKSRVKRGNKRIFKNGGKFLEEKSNNGRDLPT
ncbi:MAG: hypothetical protein AVDCRST_MAG56-6365 [uncultured Cytophagales bacterium]|uniref:Uncharacterized protein n=1 Tax=uncultured Cytophagales bacterium TaxID=158755 RepID=A0A6J4KQT0_9SPHI|nr:MAG: hypothetical protein AVDCRST_MAG56-6365 [uncultured Cytophagales bacterium]